MNKCQVCQKETNKCCSVCRKAFYCSAEHQEEDWFAQHCNECKENNFNESPQQNKKNQETFLLIKQKTKIFIDVFEERLILRDKVIIAHQKTYSSEAAAICQQLLATSAKVSSLYQTKISFLLHQAYGIETNEFIILMDQWLDKTMVALYFWKNGFEHQTKSLLIQITKHIEDYPSFMGAANSISYKRLLSIVIYLAEALNYDKTVEKMQAHFIKLVERFEGIWQQISVYFNMGSWYASKTYYQKAASCFKHALDILNAHNLGKQQHSQLIKADLLFNLAQCYKMNGEKHANEIMWDCYRARVQGVGKNSLEASDALSMLAHWAFDDQDDSACMQYLQECFRVRKLNAPIHNAPLQQTTAFIKQIYQFKFKSMRQEMPDTARYLEEIIYNEESNKQSQEKESFAKRLFQDHKDYIDFKLVIFPQLAQSFTSEQWSFISELLDMEGKHILKEEASKLILESNFSLSLNDQQRDLFIKQNRII